MYRMTYLDAVLGIPKKIVIFAFGGFIGAVCNWTITYSLTEYFYLYYLLSNLIGSTVNILFNFIYHRSITFNVFGDTGRRFVKFLIFSIVIIMLNISITFILTEVFGLWYLFSVITATFIVVTFNFAVNQLYIFFDIDKINVRYEEVGYDFYNRQTNSINPIRSWFHVTRYEILDSIVDRYYSQGKKIVDLGSGSCEWNVRRLPVIGVDLNRNMLEYAKSKGHLIDYKVSNIDAVDFENSSVDIIIISEVLEHIKDYNNLINEIYRVLKPNGIAIVTVPYDTVISFWKPLFFIQCLIQGYIFGNKYYQNKCGHVHSFSPQKVRNIFSSKGFSIIDQFDILRFTIFTVVQRADEKDGKNG